MPLCCKTDPRVHALDRYVVVKLASCAWQSVALLPNERGPIPRIGITKHLKPAIIQRCRRWPLDGALGGWINLYVGISCNGCPAKSSIASCRTANHLNNKAAPCHRELQVHVLRSWCRRVRTADRHMVTKTDWRAVRLNSCQAHLYVCGWPTLVVQQVAIILGEDRRCLAPAKFQHHVFIVAQVATVSC